MPLGPLPPLVKGSSCKDELRATTNISHLYNSGISQWQPWRWKSPFPDPVRKVSRSPGGRGFSTHTQGPAPPIKPGDADGFHEHSKKNGLQINSTQLKKNQTWLGLWEIFHSAMVTHWIKAAQRPITFHFSVPGYYRKQPRCSWIVRQIVNFVSLKRRPKNICSCL